jgi:hypothetical protein
MPLTATVGAAVDAEDRSPTTTCPSVAAVGVDIGGVDADTEYLHPRGWRKISDYREGEELMQYLPERGVGQFVAPQGYLVRDQEWFYYLKTKYGIDQVLTPDHRMLVWEIKGRGRDRVQSVMTAQRFVDRHEKLAQGFKAEIETSFSLDPCLVRTPIFHDWTLPCLRVQVMTAADSTLDGQSAVLHLSKRRKIERAEKLLADAGIQYTLREQSDGTTYVRYRPPLFRKDLQWVWELPPSMLSVVSAEVLHWDGNKKDQVFFTRRSADADAVQFAFTACGYRSTKRADVAKDGVTDYRVFRVEKTKIGMASVPKTEVSRVDSADGKAYCFRVPSGFLVLRRNGNIFVTATAA